MNSRSSPSSHTCTACFCVSSSIFTFPSLFPVLSGNTRHGVLHLLTLLLSHFNHRPIQEMIMFRTAVMLICKLPEEKLRRIVANKNLNSVMAIRRCASDLNWYYVPKPMRVCSADGCDKRGESFGECSACGIAEYCSGQCQRNDWLKHKPMCVSWRQKTTT